MSLGSFTWEIIYMTFIQSFESNILNFFMTIFTLLGDEYCYVIFLTSLYFCFDKEKAKKIGIITLTTLYINSFIKGIFVRKRPYFDHSEIKCIRAAHPYEDVNNYKLQGYSFPSMHSSAAISFYGMLITYVKKNIYKILLGLLIILIGLSRNYLGVHYPTDVLAGFLLGLVTMILVNILDNKMKNKKLEYLILSLVGIAGLFINKDYEYYSVLGIQIGALLSFLYEDKYVRFEKPKTILRGIIRVAVAFGIFFGMKELMRLGILMIVPDKSSMMYMYLSCIKYFICTFVIFGLYPKIFKKFNKEKN